MALEGRKVGSLKRRVRSQLARWEVTTCTRLWHEAHFQAKSAKNWWGRSTFGSCDVEKVHVDVARSTFASEKAKSTARSKQFWKLSCRKSARRCGAKQISKSKCTKHTNFGALFEVQMFKKCTPLWREAHLQVKMLKALHVRTTFDVSDVVLRGRRKKLCTLSKVSKTWRGCSSFNCNHHHATLHYTATTTTTPLHYNYKDNHNHNCNHNYNYNYPDSYNYTTLHSLHSTTLHSTSLHPITLHYATTKTITTTTTTLPYATLHYTNYITLHSTPLRYTTLHSTTLRSNSLHFNALHSVSLRQSNYTNYNYSYNYNYNILQLHLQLRLRHIALQLHYATLHVITLHYTTLITLDYTTLPYITLHNTTLHQLQLQLH